MSVHVCKIPSCTLLYYLILLFLSTIFCIEKMTIHIQIIHSKRMIEYEMRNTDTVADVKKKLQEEINIKATRVVLISGGVELKDNCLLFNSSAYSCQHATLQLMLPMTGTVCWVCWLEFYLASEYT